MNMVVKGANNKKDVFYYLRTEYSSYDVIISNIVNKVSIILTNRHLIEEITGPDKLMSLNKNKSLFEGLYSAVGNSVFSI